MHAPAAEGGKRHVATTHWAFTGAARQEDLRWRGFLKQLTTLEELCPAQK